MSENPEHLRRYFRVMDRVGLRVHLVTDEVSADSGSGAKPLLSPEQRLVKVNGAINKHLSALKKKDESLATLLGLLNHKMDLLVSGFEKNVSDDGQEKSHAFHVCEVNLSACGIAFPSTKELQKAQTLSLHLKLFPSQEVVNPVAMVVGCERRDAFSADLSEDEKAELKERPYWVRANFEDISAVEQELLAQHVIQKQANELAGRRKVNSANFSK
ncbi:hypothetical protein [Oleiphilus sp. HI0080]|uniref:hypothetical protein n=1 Tax=Oleiphilus sp. HI0080 TaxID=1822255 RepID=UPI000AF5880F|nr:hypothetical protein [Oleiphilus sp. HI0080]